MQPIIRDDDGVVRFKANKIVRHLVDWCATKNRHPGYNRLDASGRAPDLNELAGMNFDVGDWQQLAQLLGYSLSGYGDLSYVTDDAYARAEAAAAVEAPPSAPTPAETATECMCGSHVYCWEHDHPMGPQGRPKRLAAEAPAETPREEPCK